MLCVSVFDIVYKYFYDVYKFKISRPKYLFLWCLFLAIKWVQKGVYRKGVGGGLLWDEYEVCKINLYSSTYEMNWSQM